MKNAKTEIVKHINDRKVIYIDMEIVSMEIDIDDGGIIVNPEGSNFKINEFKELK